jgi:hypothetical protein
MVETFWDKQVSMIRIRAVRRKKQEETDGMQRKELNTARNGHGTCVLPRKR